MILFDIITWPVRALLSLLSSLFRLILSICLFPFRLAASIARSLWIKVCYVFQYAENKLSILKTWKPFCYLFPLTPVSDSSGLTNQNEDEPPEMKAKLRRKEYKSRSPSPDETDEGQSISSLIQDLLKISQTETQPQERGADKIQLLLQELNELAAAGGLTGNNDDTPAGASPKVNRLLEDLSTLESYLTQFLSDDEEEGHLPLPPDRMSSLETILEETASKESSPLHCRSPVPHKEKKPHPLAVQTIEEERELTHSQNQISQNLLLLLKVAKSQELKQSLQQMSDMHRQEEEEEETTPTIGEGAGSDQEKTTPSSAKERRESLKNQLDSSQNEMDSLISSLDQHQKFMSSQRELQEAMDSLNEHTTGTKATPPKTTPPKTAALGGGASSKLATPPNTEQIYDSLSAISPVYTDVVKRPRPSSIMTSQESIYDSIKTGPVATATDETPPPIPLRRTLSDVSTDSCDNSPIFSRRRGSISDEDRECCHGSHRRRQGNSKRNGRRHSSTSSCKHCDHSPERYHQSRSKERPSYHSRHRSPSGDSQDEERREGRRQGHRHESGYESHQDFESPTLTRRSRGRHSSDSTWGPLTPPTPRDSKRGFLGFFSKKSTSLTSLASTKSDAGERGSISSYKL